MKNLADIVIEHSDNLSKQWIRKVRQAGNLKTYNALSGARLLEHSNQLHKMLCAWFDKEADKNKIGAFFVEIGKTRLREGFAISEVSYAIFLAQRTVLEFLTNDYLSDSSIAMYNALNLSGQVAEFFLLGNYYMMKGYLEDIFVSLNRDECLPVETLRKYFSDDLFFKNSN